jgi:hypothetical protein
MDSPNWTFPTSGGETAISGGPGRCKLLSFDSVAEARPLLPLCGSMEN